ncbi:hypothetical protein QDA11_gp81 [Microbacterium phage Jayden]|uniref:Uncharacterized protein n=1 Tax=Microbacterium phage Jayden TaxID=2656550 RepID=A0A649VRX5_9CAUD|nr:hypothetical protein QDA11_gp81 [Microbacterium phage Jayden]QGJ95300.1 hypothetical protein PBI_JAYDEN_81 [Microbacterium phage Jayden]
MRKFTSGAIAVLLAGAGLAFTAAPASAHTPAASATCEAITINASYYETKPASGEPTIANPDYRPAIPGTPAIGDPQITVDNPDYIPAKDAVTHVEYEWKSWNWSTLRFDYRWSATNPGTWWIKTGEQKVVTDEEAQPAVGEPTIVIDNPDYVPAVPESPAVGEPTIPNPEYVEADATPNTVTVTVDGEEVYSAEFGESHSATIPLDGKKHSWIASFVGWNGIGTETIKGKVSACPPVGITVPDLTVTPPTCEAHGSLPFLSNPAAENPNGYEFPGEGFRVYLDKPFEGAGTYVATLQKVGPGFDPAFPYGTKITGGNTSQVLTVLPATGYQGDDADAPCYQEPPVTPEEPEEESEEPTTPTTPEEPTGEKPTTVVTAARTVQDGGTLAQTGADPMVTVWGLTGGALAVALGAGAVVLGLRRRQLSDQQ